MRVRKKVTEGDTGSQNLGSVPNGVRIVLSVNGNYCDVGTLSRRVTAKDETKVFGKEDE